MDVCRFKPQTSTNACGHICRHVDPKGLAVMLTSVWSAGVAPEVNLRITQVRKHAKRIYPSFKIQGRQQEKDLCPPKIKKKVCVSSPSHQRSQKTWCEIYLTRHSINISPVRRGVLHPTLTERVGLTSWAVSSCFFLSDPSTQKGCVYFLSFLVHHWMSNTPEIHL